MRYEVECGTRPPLGYEDDGLLPNGWLVRMNADGTRTEIVS